MASKAIIAVNRTKQHLSSVVEKKKRFIKIIQYDQSIPADFMFQLSLRMSSLKKNSHAVRSTNRCILTGRRHGTYRIFRISRIKVREFVTRGILPGIRKSSW